MQPEIAVAAVTPDPDSLLYSMYSSKVPPTWMSAEHLKDAKVDELLDAGRSEPDPAKRAAIYKAARRAPARTGADALSLRPDGGVHSARAVSCRRLADQAKATSATSESGFTLHDV